MYNDAIKREFLENAVNSKSLYDFCEDVFLMSEDKEEELNKDICTFDLDELLSVIGNRIGVSKAVKSPLVHGLSKYVTWMRDTKHVTVSDAIFSLDETIDNKFRDTHIANPRELIVRQNKIFRPISENGGDLIYRAYEWLAYMRVPEKKCTEILVSDVDFDNMVITVDDTDYPMYVESLPIFRKLVNLDHMNLMHHTDNNGNPVYVDYKRFKSDKLLRGTKANPVLVTIKTSTSKMAAAKNKELGGGIKVLGYKWLWESGWFYVLYENERAGVKADLGAIVAAQQEISTRKSDPNLTHKRLIMTKHRYKMLYEQWKRVFTVS